MLLVPIVVSGFTWLAACGSDKGSAAAPGGAAGSAGTPASGAGASTGGQGSGDAGNSPGGTTGEGGAGGEEAVEPCGAEYVGSDSWRGTLRVSGKPFAVCGAPREYRPLEKDLALKAVLRMPSGEYPLPEMAGTQSLTLPICLQTRSAAPLASAGGRVVTVLQTLDNRSSHRFRFTQPMSSGASVQLDAAVYPENGSFPELRLNPQGSTDKIDEYQHFSLCEEEECSGVDDVHFLPCNPTDYALARHRVEFEGGHVILDLRVAVPKPGQATAGTEPAQFVRAQGELDGQSFEQADYFRLAYSPEHHHFVRSFAVVFDAPIAEACALRIEGLDPFDGGESVGTVSTADCALNVVEERDLTTHRLLP